MSLNKIFDEFNDMYGLGTKGINHDSSSMISLIQDEVNELSDEVKASFEFNQSNVVKELIDIVYITCQQMRERGVDIDSALAEVHRSNMSKILPMGMLLGDISKEINEARDRYPDVKLVENPNGYVMKCESTGKVVKPKCYSEAVITKEMIK